MRIHVSRIILLACLAALLPNDAAAQVYKWRDERGVVHYGEKPPAGAAASVVDARPYGVETGEPPACHTILCQGERLEEQRRREFQAESMRVAAAPPSTPPVRGMEFEVYIRLQNGMSEGELLQRAGPPDFQSVDALRHTVGRTYYYYPTSANPFTTIVTLRGGRIFSLERIRKF